MPDVYESCPVIQGPTLMLRPIVMEDAEDLLLVYGDPANVPLFNSDNCHGNFHMPLLEDMQRCIQFWLQSYAWKQFVRWSIVERQFVIGTVECFHRGTDGSIPDCALLRIDLRQDRDTPRINAEILSVLLPRLEELFQTACAVIKAPPLARNRIAALKEHGFQPTDAPLIGDHGTPYHHYWIKPA